METCRANAPSLNTASLAMAKSLSTSGRQRTNVPHSSCHVLNLAGDQGDRSTTLLSCAQLVLQPSYGDAHARHRRLARGPEEHVREDKIGLAARAGCGIKWALI